MSDTARLSILLASVALGALCITLVVRRRRGEIPRSLGGLVIPALLLAPFVVGDLIPAPERQYVLTATWVALRP